MIDKELWAYAGARFHEHTTMVDEWHADEGRAERPFRISQRTRTAQYVIGGIYVMRVERVNPDRITRHGPPVFTGRTVAEAVRLAWTVDDTRARMARQHRSDAADVHKRNALDEALIPLRALYHKQRTDAAREALLLTAFRRVVS